MDIEALLRRFELGESAYVVAVEPLPLDALDALGTAFVAQYDQSGDLRYLNAMLKLVDREGFAQRSPQRHREWGAWTDVTLNALRKERGLA